MSTRKASEKLPRITVPRGIHKECYKVIEKFERGITTKIAYEIGEDPATVRTFVNHRLATQSVIKKIQIWCNKNSNLKN